MPAEEVIHAKLEVLYEDLCGYTTYVFRDLESDRYIMCVKFPNWNQSVINIGDTGFLRVRYVEEGKDEWYDGTDLIKYKNTDIIFLKFVHEKSKINDIILD